MDNRLENFSIDELYRELYDRLDGRIVIWQDEDARVSLRDAGEIEDADEDLVQELWFEIGDELTDRMCMAGWEVIDRHSRELAERI